MAVNDRRYGLSIIYCYRLQNNSPQNQQHLVSPVKGKCHALRDKRVVKADYLYLFSIIVEYIYKFNP